MHKQLLEHLHDDQRVRGRIQLLPQVHIAEHNGPQLLAIDLAYTQSPPSAVGSCTCYAARCMAIDHGMAATQDAHACAPSACNTSLPNVLTTRRYPQRPCDHHAQEVASKARGCVVRMSVAPARGTGQQCRCTFCTICFAMMSASTTGKPCAAKSADTVLFPVAIPPVRPMTRMVICACDQSGTARQFLRNSPDGGSTQEQMCCARGRNAMVLQFCSAWSDQ